MYPQYCIQIFYSIFYFQKFYDNIGNDFRENANHVTEIVYIFCNTIVEFMLPPKIRKYRTIDYFIANTLTYSDISTI